MTSVLFTIADLVLVQCLTESGHTNICQSNEWSCSISPVIKEMQIKTTIRYNSLTRLRDCFFLAVPHRLQDLCSLTRD